MATGPGRPRKQGLTWFSMDVNMDQDFEALEELHGNDGFVWMVKFWQEAYRSNDGHVNLDGIRGVIAAKKARISTDKQAEIVRACIDLGLLEEVRENVYSSNGVQKRLEQVLGKRENDRNSGKNEIPESSRGENTAIRGESKVKESKVKEKKRDLPVSSGSKNKIENHPDFLKYYGIAKMLETRILERKQQKINEDTLKSWANTVRIMVKKDKRALPDIAALIDICHDMPTRKGFTWANQILSMDTLRRQWDDGKVFLGMEANGYGMQKVEAPQPAHGKTVLGVLAQKINADVGLTEREYAGLPPKWQARMKTSNDLWYREHDQLTFTSEKKEADNG